MCRKGQLDNLRHSFQFWPMLGRFVVVRWRGALCRRRAGLLSGSTNTIHHYPIKDNSIPGKVDFLHKRLTSRQFSRFSFEGALCPQPVNQCGEGLKPVETEVETLDGCPYYKVDKGSFKTKKNHSQTYFPPLVPTRGIHWVLPTPGMPPWSHRSDGGDNTKASSS